MRLKLSLPRNLSRRLLHFIDIKISKNTHCKVSVFDYSSIDINCKKLYNIDC